jgi:hypothetical protein
MGENRGMNTVVFFPNLDKLHEAFSYFNLDGFAGKRVPVKLHMGEMKNPHYSPPDFVRLVVNGFKQVGADPFLFDTTVAYPGLRYTIQGYEKVARLHGFSEKKIGCDVVIGDTGIPISLENRTFHVAEQLVGATHLVAISHGKGHIQTGFGGAIKNFGMGGVIRETKKQIHRGSKPVYTPDACTYCGVCAEMCPFDALTVTKHPEKWTQNTHACFGCGVCVDVCKDQALSHVDADLQYLIMLAAHACLQGKNALFINELKRMAKSCDCDPFPGPPIVPDIGYLIADDPVAIDKASLDLIDEVKPDIFQETNGIDPYKQIKYGETIGLGSASYQLIEL